MMSSLDVGLETAKGLALAWDVPLIGVNHMQAHALTVRLENALKGLGANSPEYPFLSLLVSGGHTMIVLSRGLTDHEILADTVDTAVGDALDKIGRVVVPEDRIQAKKDNTMYAKEMEAFAYDDIAVANDFGYKAQLRDTKTGLLENEYGWKVPVPYYLESKADKDPRNGVLKFSFSGIRSSIDRLIDDRKALAGPTNDWADFDEKQAIAREVMRKCWEHLASRLVSVLQYLPQEGVWIQQIVVSGGVAANKFLRVV